MSFGGGFFGGGTSTKKTYQTATTETYTQATQGDIQIGGSPGSVVGAGAASGQLGAIVAGPKANVTQDVAYNYSGMGGDDLLKIMEAQQEINRQSDDAAHRLAELTITGVTAATQGRSIDWKQYIPFAIVGVIAIAVVRRR